MSPWMMRELRSIPNWFPSSAELMHSIWSWNFAIAIEYLLQELVLELTMVCRSALKPGVQLNHVACMIGYQPVCLTTLSLGFKVITWVLKYFEELNLALKQQKCSFPLFTWGWTLLWSLAFSTDIACAECMEADTLHKGNSLSSFPRSMLN